MPIVLERSNVRDHYKNAEFVGYFKLLRGNHCEGGVRYLKGDVIHSKADLEKQNQLPDSIKFIRVDDPGDVDSLPPLSHGHPTTPGDPKNPVGVKESNTVGFTREELSELNKEDLIETALEEGLVFDLKMKKEDMISSLLGEGEKV
jgi:hypothetical protein